MLEIKQNQTNGQNGRDRANLTLLILILGVLSVASIGILVLAMLRQMYPKVFAAPGIAKQLNYQGKLQDAGGVVVPDGSYGMQFTIYDSAAGGNILWTSRESDACGAPFNPAAKTISTSNGIFSTLLGEAGDCSINLDFADDSYYLGVTVGADPEMTPRKRIGAAGYAFNADLLDGLNTSDAGGSVAFVPVTDASGNLFLTKDFTVTSPEVGAQAVYGVATDTSAIVNYGGYFTAAGTGFTPPLGFTTGVYGEATSNAAIANLGGYFVSRGTGANAAGVAGLASATGAVQNIGGLFIAQGDTGRGVYGFAMGATATQKYGVFGDSQGTGVGSAGVRGRVTGNADDISGVYGEANSSSPGNFKTYAGRFYTNGWQGRAVFGEAVSPPGTGVANYGGYFTAGSDLGRGVYGEASNGGAITNYGGYFLAKGGNGRAVYGEADAGGVSLNYGGYFTAAGGSNGTSGVYGVATDSGLSTQNYGGQFIANGEYGMGVFGEATTVTGSGTGVYGHSGSGTGGSFLSDGGNMATGVSASVGTAMMMIADANRAIFSHSVLNNGKINYGGDFNAAFSTVNNYGISATASSILSSVQNWGGSFTATGDTSYGVQARATGSGAAAVNYGGHFTADGGMGVGVYGAATSPTGWAGYFTGGQGVYEEKVMVGPVVAAPAENLQVVGNIANLADTNFNPVLKSTTPAGIGPIQGVVSDKYFYVLNSGSNTLQIFDVTDSVSPTLVSTTATNAFPRYVYVSGRYAYIVHDTATNTLEIFDVSNPAAPVSISSTATVWDGKSIYVSGHYAYIAENAGTFEIFDVSNPAAPVSISSTATGTDPFNVYVSGRYAYVVSQMAGTLQIFDVSNPAAPVLLPGSVATGGDLRGVYVSGPYAYVANLGAGTLQIFDVKNPSAPASAGGVAAGGAYSVYVSGRYAYVADIFGNTIKVIDVSIPASPTVVGSTATGSNPTSVYVSGRYAYIANIGANNFEIFDVSGLEVTSGMVHSLEAGNLQVRNDIIAQGELNVNGGLSVGGTGLFNDSLSVHSIGGVGGYFQADGASATGLFGYTSSSYSTAISGYAVGADSTGISAFADPLAAAATSSRGGSFFAGTGSATIGGLVSYMMGVEGIADGGTGTNYGGVFTAGNLVSRTLVGQNNIGVAGFAEDSPGNNYGVYGATTSVSGWAGYFTGGYGLYADRANIGRLPAANDTANALVIEGSLCVDDATANCPAGPTDGYIYAVGTLITGIDLAENIPSVQELEAGDVVSVDLHNSQKVVKSVRTYDDTVMGVVSTKPGLLLGSTSKSDNYPIALAGRVPVKVSTENGPIKIGDKLTSGSQPGVAMRATEPGATIGIALEPFEQQTGVGLVEAFINVDWSSGITNVTEITTTSPASSGYDGISDKLTADLDAGGFAIDNVSKITGANEAWSIDEKGLLRIRVEFSRDNETIKKDIYALSSTGAEIVLSGSSKLDRGEILVDFSQVDKDFPEIVDEKVPLKISVTPTADCQGMYVAEKYPQGFKVKESNGGISGATFDWIVIGQRKGYGTAAERQ